MAILVSAQHLIEELAYCSFCFKYGITMVHRSGQVGVSKCDPPVWRTAQDLARGRLAIAPKEEPGLRTQIGVSPAIQDDPGDVPPCVESAACEHLGELFADLSFIISERFAQHVSAAAIPLLFGWSSGI